MLTDQTHVHNPIDSCPCIEKHSASTGNPYQGNVTAPLVGYTGIWWTPHPACGAWFVVQSCFSLTIVVPSHG
jgi:hypothetical protein